MLIKYWQGTYELRATNPFPREPLMARLVHPLSKPILIILNPRIMDHYIDVITTAELKVLMEQYAAEYLCIRWSSLLQSGETFLILSYANLSVIYNTRFRYVKNNMLFIFFAIITKFWYTPRLIRSTWYAPYLYRIIMGLDTHRNIIRVTATNVMCQTFFNQLHTQTKLTMWWGGLLHRSFLLRLGQDRRYSFLQ